MLKFAPQTKTTPQMGQLCEEVSKTRRLLQQLESDYNTFTDSDLVDYCIYEKLALTAKLNYLLKAVKEEELRASRETQVHPLLPLLGLAHR